MAQIKFHKVGALPGTLEANAVYFVANGSYSETYVTNQSGTALAVGNSAMINALIAAQLTAVSELQKVASIAARNALTLNRNSIVLVVDATADATVSAGAALYFWDHTAASWIKIAEYESLDVITAWNSISGRPSSAVADIDDAVAKRHTHGNLATLNKLGEADGALTFDGTSVSASWNTNNW